MIKSKYFPGRTFTSKAELFKALKANKKTIEELKRADLKDTDGFLFIPPETSKMDGETVKAVTSFQLDESKSYHVINTTNYLDSHNDVHVNGIWDKSVSEQQGKVFFVADHHISITSMIAHKSDVEMFLKELNWSELNQSYEGKTQALIFAVLKDKIRLQIVKDIIKDKLDVEHSIRMSYVNIDLAIDDSSEDYEDEKNIWDKTIGVVANKAEAIEQGYFWRISEAKIQREGSMVVSGSNDATPRLEQSETGKGKKPIEETTEKIASSYNRLVI